MRTDAQANRRDLLDAASRLFAEQGAEVALRTVAKAAEVGIGTLYRHFPTREDLVLGVLDDAWRQVTEIVETHLASEHDDPDTAWASFVHELAALEFGALAYQLKPFTQQSAELAEAAKAQRTHAMRTLDAVMDSAHEAALVAPDITAERFFIGLATITRPLPRDVDEKLPGQQEWIVDTYMRGLKPLH